MVLLGLALGSAWLVSELDTGTSRPVAAGDANVPDLYMEDFTTTTMTESGRPGRRLSADSMAHFPATGMRVFTRPHLKVYAERREPWQAISERGELAPGSDELLLLGDVDIWRNNPDGTLEIRIETSDVRVLPETEYAETDEPALITTQSGYTKGVGLRAFMKDSRIELLSEVHTVVERIGGR